MPRVRGRCQPDPRRCAPAAFGAGRGRPASQSSGACGVRVSQSAQRYGVRRIDADDAQAHQPYRSRCALDRGNARLGLLRLFHELSDRSRPRGDRRCRGDDRDPAGGGACAAPDDQAHAGSVRPAARKVGGRYGLRFRAEPRLVGRRAGHRAAHPGVRQVRPLRDDTYERSAFTFDHDDDSYICLDGNRLRPSNRNFSTPRPRANADGFIRYRAREKDCGACAPKQCYTPKLAARKILRSVH